MTIALGGLLTRIIIKPLQEMASLTRRSVDTAARANAIAHRTLELADTGVVAMRRMTEAAGRVQSSTANTAQIVRAIDKLTTHSKWLALNAAIESAHANDSDRRFAVLAHEALALAQQSAEAARLTTELIAHTQNAATAAINTTAEVTPALDSIRESVGRLTTLITEIASASTEQSQGISQVNAAVVEMDRVGQQNAANAEASAIVSEEMSHRVAEIVDMLEDAPGDADSQRQRDLLLSALHNAIHRPDPLSNNPAQARSRAAR